MNQVKYFEYYAKNYEKQLRFYLNKKKRTKLHFVVIKNCTEFIIFAKQISSERIYESKKKKLNEIKYCNALVIIK
jgi:hypothetical protein